jgi:predicted RNase H-like HicB family nuclease
MKYLVVYEKSASGWGAYAPDLPGLGVVGQTIKETKQLIREAIEFHLEGMRQHGEPIVSSGESNHIVIVRGLVKMLLVPLLLIANG